MPKQRQQQQVGHQAEYVAIGGAPSRVEFEVQLDGQQGQDRGLGRGHEDNVWRRGRGTGRGGWTNNSESTNNRTPQVLNHYQRGFGFDTGASHDRGSWRSQSTRNVTQNKQHPVQEQGEIRLKAVSKIVGICDKMCPQSEIILREREGLLHKFEILQDQFSSCPVSSWHVEGASNIGVVDGKRGGRTHNQSGTRKPLPKADVKKIIKSFSRSAAGQNKTLPEDLRRVQVLKDTVKYLCQEILTRTDCPFNFIYDFMFDRLRAVRQDLVIQRIEDEDAMRILETIVKFHIYSEFRLREESISIYDPHINQKHLVDCLRKLLSLYEFNDYNGSSRAEFEALNCLVYVNSYDVLTRAFSIKKYINSETLNVSIDMALSYQCKNFVSFFRKIVQLSCILQMYCIRHVPVMREFAFRIMSVSYGVNACKVPLTWITSVLLYSSNTETHRDLAQLNVEILRDQIKNEKYAKFQKGNVIELKADQGIRPDLRTPCIQSLLNDVKNEKLTRLCLSF